MSAEDKEMLYHTCGSSLLLEVFSIPTAATAMQEVDLLGENAESKGRKRIHEKMVRRRNPRRVSATAAIRVRKGLQMTIQEAYRNGGSSTGRESVRSVGSRRPSSPVTAGKIAAGAK